MSASVHPLTPIMSVIGPRGETVRQVEYLRTVAGEAVRALISRLHYDAAGHRVAQRDPRLPTPNTTTVFRLDGMAVKARNVDGGENTVLPALDSEPLQNWDANGNHRQMSYDPQRRLRSVTENGVTGFESFSYDNASADPTHNRRGQMTALSDPSGAVQFNSFAMSGQVLEETRTFKNGKACTSRQRFSAMGALLQTTDAGGHVQQSSYDIAGQLVRARLQLSGQNFLGILNGADYNAAGQITEQRLGNGVTSHWHYRETDGRLLRQYAQKASEPAIQDFQYEYDRVGNPVRIVDHTRTATFFHNQRVDGERTFGYDSMYRLVRATGYSDAPPADNPGRPQPTDPDDRRNYVESFEYDDGNNLKKLTHVRDGNTYTREMFIDPASNRGVRWKPGDPAPDFSTLFDRAGNLLALQPGQPLHWNSRHQLESLILVDHVGGPPDQELYHYSQGKRVYKRHETHTSTVSHVTEVHYARSLEIRTKSNGEELHRITVATGVGEVTCLHWVAGKPPGIDADRVCYSHSDHLGSSVTQLDQRAQVISRESYYPFGNTASLAARSQIEADYKFTRYCGKEMDVTGLYYYGARYYAPWFCRWVSADPAREVDGLNLYGFVGNNPLRYVDQAGKQKEERAILDYSAFITGLGNYASNTMDLMDAIAHQKNIGRSLLKNLIGESINAAVAFVGGYLGSQNFDFLLPDDPHVANFTSQTRPPFSQGLVGGNIGAEIAGGLFSQFVPSAHLIRPLIPQTSKMTVQTIDREVGIDPSIEETDWLQTFIGIFLNNVVGSTVPGVNVALGMGSRVQEAEDIKSGLDPVKLLKIEKMLDSWESAVRKRSADAEKAFAELNLQIVTSGSQRIVRRDLQEQTSAVLGMIESTRTTVFWMRQDATSDGRYLMKQARDRKRAYDRH
ncbi:RHS repeat domain-containing protein [Pseudomonas bananamidigenes]|uniref:RHS repeat domain-containing protein n=1 Tax=Pseudomonas bananamidigenes TaxID=2843610 RepID=UPI000802FB50|nr:RHS repeat-associated core domain-containing protein [Pseudomonas bananamidigenes]